MSTEMATPKTEPFLQDDNTDNDDDVKFFQVVNRNNFSCSGHQNESAREIIRLNSELASANAEKNYFREEKAELKQENVQLREKNETLSTKIHEMQMKELEGRLQNGETKALEKQLDEAKETLKRSAMQTQELEAELRVANTQVGSTIAELNEAKEKISSLESQNKQEVNKLEGELLEAKTKLEQELQKEKLHQKKQSKLQNDLQNARNDGKNAKDQIKKLQTDLAKTETEVKNLRKTIAGMEKNSEEITEKYETLKREQDELAKKAREEHEKKIEQLRAELKKAEAENYGKPDGKEKRMAKIDENEKNYPEASSEPVNKKQKQKKTRLDSNAKFVSPTSAGGNGLKSIVPANSNYGLRKRPLRLPDRIAFDGALSLHKRNKYSVETSPIAEHATIMSKIYAFSLDDSQQWAKFDCETNKWIGLSCGSFGVSQRSFFDVATIGRKICIIGGKIDEKVSTNCYALDPQSMTSLLNAPIVSELEIPRKKSSSVVIEDTIYVFGGGSTYNKAPKTTPVECYSSEAGAWARKGEIKSRNSASSAVLDRVAYVFGGYDGHNRLHFVERYDPREATVECVAKMVEYRVGASAVAHNGRIYVAGGYNKGLLDTDTVEIFDPRASACINGPAMNTPRTWHGLFSDGTQLLAIGGNNANHSLNSMEVLVPSGTENDNWTYHPAEMPFSGGIRIAAI